MPSKTRLLVVCIRSGVFVSRVVSRGFCSGVLSRFFFAGGFIQGVLCGGLLYMEVSSGAGGLSFFRVFFCGVLPKNHINTVSKISALPTHPYKLLLILVPLPLQPLYQYPCVAAAVTVPTVSVSLCCSPCLWSPCILVLLLLLLLLLSLYTPAFNVNVIAHQ